MICILKTSKFNDLRAQNLLKQCKNIGFQNPISRDSLLIAHKPRTPLSKWLIRSAHVYSIRFNHSISTPNNWSNLSCKMRIRLFAISTRMPHPLGMLMVIILLFVVSGFHLGLFLRQVSMSLTIGLAFGIFVLDNGEVSWSMWILLGTSYDSLLFYGFKNVKCPFSLNFHL
jgi:hypothetical protein